MSLTKRLNASNYFLDFLIWSILSLLGTRLFLELTGFFTLGRGNWHIAHVLWGGLLMLLGIIVFLIFSGKSAIRLASIFSGIGWGLFIDEIGKFITRDNNYWFRPAIIFIYTSIILLFLLYRFLEKKSVTDFNVLWNDFLEDYQEILSHDLEIKEKKDLLKKINLLQKFPSTPNEKKLLLDFKSIINCSPVKKDKYKLNLSRVIANSLKITYTRLFKKTLVFYGLFSYSIWYIGDKIIDTIKLFSNSNKILLLQNYYRHYDFFSRTDVYMISFKFIVEVITALFFVVGLYFWLRKKTIRGIRFYQLGLLLNIFIGSFIKFYFEQFSGVFSLILALIIWSWLDSFRRERILSLTHKT